MKFFMAQMMMLYVENIYQQVTQNCFTQNNLEYEMVLGILIVFQSFIINMTLQIMTRMSKRTLSKHKI